MGRHRHQHRAIDAAVLGGPADASRSYDAMHRRPIAYLKDFSTAIFARTAGAFERGALLVDMSKQRVCEYYTLKLRKHENVEPNGKGTMDR